MQRQRLGPLSLNMALFQLPGFKETVLSIGPPPVEREAVEIDAVLILYWYVFFDSFLSGSR